MHPKLLDDQRVRNRPSLSHLFTQPFQHNHADWEIEVGWKEKHRGEWLFTHGQPSPTLSGGEFLWLAVFFEPGILVIFFLKKCSIICTTTEVATESEFQPEEKDE